MTKRPWISAEELMADLQRDSAYLEQQKSLARERSARQERIRALHAPILEDYRRIGVVANSIEDLVARYAPLPENIVDRLLAWISASQEPDVLEPLVRALAATTLPYDGRPVVDVFSKTDSEFVQWAAANTLATTSPTGVAAWVADAVRDPRYGRARDMLVMALARLASPAEANRVLVSIFDEIPTQVTDALAISGGPSELAFLQSKQGDYRGATRKQIDKAIRRLQKRLARP
jgi:hypothetical protein